MRTEEAKRMEGAENCHKCDLKGQVPEKAEKREGDPHNGEGSGSCEGECGATNEQRPCCKCM